MGYLDASGLQYWYDKLVNEGIVTSIDGESEAVQIEDEEYGRFDLLWWNASPESGFPAQEVYIGDIRPYQIIIIVYMSNGDRTYSGSPVNAAILVPLNTKLTNDEGPWTDTATVLSNNPTTAVNALYSRMAELSDGNGHYATNNDTNTLAYINFANGYRDGTAGNQFAKPLYIYGVRLGKA